jgi:uncharacterized membrane protein YccC
MSELDELDKKFDVGNMTNLDLCVVWHNHQVPLEVANRAAAELAQLCTHITDLEEQAETYRGAREIIDKLRAAVEEARSKVSNLINNLPEIEIEVAREAWGNTNTRIILDARRALAAWLEKFPKEQP